MEDMVSNMEEKEGTVLLRKMEDDSQVLELKENEVESFARTLESGGELIEIGFTICYREHYSLLNYPETTTRTVCLPIGVMTRIEFASGAVFLCFQDNNELQRESSRSLLRCLLETQCDKVCYEAQAFIEFVMDVMKEADVKISYHWNLLDPKIGIWLIDPDHPPNSFQNVLETFNLTVNGLDGSADWKETVAKYLAAQSKSKRKLYDTLTSLSLWDVFYNMETPLVPILAAMEQRRLKLNCDQLQEISNLLKEKMTTLEHKAWKLVGKQFSMTSPVQLRKILYDQLKLDELGAVQIKSTASLGAKSTDEGTLKKLEKLHPLPGLILEFRHALKIKSTYLDGILSNVEDQTYIRTTWEQCAAATGRITSSNPNLQSIPKRNEAFDVQGESFNLRKLFISRQCHVFIAADFQQIELRTFAQLSNDQKLISALKQPQDIFWTMTKIRLGNDNFDASEREKTKLLMYALLYGAGANKISELLSIDVASAQKISSDFSLLFPALKTYRSRILQDCRQNKELRSLSGRRRVFPSISATEVQLKHYTERQAFNFVIQGSAADICKAAMLRVECALMNQDFQTSLLMQIHDELLWEVEEKHEAAAKVVITKSIEESMCYWQEKFNLEVPMPVKISSGRTWGQMT